MPNPILRLRRGAQAVEFALTLPILAAVTSATADWGWYFHQSMAVTHAAVQGNRAAAQSKDDVVAVGQAVARATWDAGPGTSEATITTTLSNAKPRRVITVVTADFDCFLSLAGTPRILTHAATDHYQW